MKNSLFLLFLLFTWSASAQLSDALEGTYHPVTCPAGHDGSATFMSTDPDTDLNDLEWEVASNSPNVNLTLENGNLLITGMEYLVDHCVTFHSSDDPDFEEEFCFHNDQVATQSQMYPDYIIPAGFLCSAGTNGQLIMDFDPLVDIYYDNFEFSVFDLISGEEIIPGSILPVSGDGLIVDELPTVDMELTWTIPNTGCQWSEIVEVEANYILPEASFDLVDQNVIGAELTVDVSDDSESWVATFNDAPISTFPYDASVPSGEQAILSICHPGSLGCCDTVEFEIPEYTPIPGCTDPNSCVYKEEAEVDDGSCIYGEDCGDLDGDGIVGIDDVLVFLAQFSQSGPDFSGDFNDDWIVNGVDLLIFLVLFSD